MSLWFYLLSNFKLFGFPIHRFWAYLMKVITEMYLMEVITEMYLMKVIPETYLMKVIPKTCRRRAIWYLRFYYYHWVDTSDDGLLVHEGIICPVVSASALKWLIRYIYYWNLQFLNNVTLMEIKVLFPHAYMTLADFGYPISIFKLFGFVIFARPWWRGFQKRVLPDCDYDKRNIFVVISEPNIL